MPPFLVCLPPCATLHGSEEIKDEAVDNLAAVNVKGGIVPPVQSVVIEATTDASIFLQFVKLLIETGVLSTGDVFIVDNCMVHYQGDNIGLEETLEEMFGIRLLRLPAYHPLSLIHI